MPLANPSQTYFLGFGVEGFLNGAFVVLFALAVAFLGRNRRRPIDPLLFIGTTAVFIVSTSHFCLVFSHMYISLMVKGYAAGEEDNILLAGDSIVGVTDCIGQLILIYRCWVIWGRRFVVVILPLLMSFTSLACAVAGIGILTHLDPTAPIAPPAIVPIVKVALGLPLGTNILVTSLLLYRIWRISRSAPNCLPSKSVQAAMIVIIESGALVVVAQLTLVVLFVIQSPWQNLAVCIAEQIYGIAPTLILLQAGLGKAIDNGTRSSHSTSNSSAQASPFRIRVHQHQEQEGDSVVVLQQYGTGSGLSKSNTSLK